MITRSQFFIFFLLFQLHSLAAFNTDRQADSLRVYRLFDAGRELYSEGMYLQALDSFRLSLQTGESVLGPDHPYLRTIHNALGITYRNLGDFDQALECFLATEQLYLSEGSRYQTAIARIYNNIGNLYTSKLNYGQARDYYQRAVDIFLSRTEKDMEEIAGLYYSIANSHYNQNDYDRVIEIAEKYIPHADVHTRLMFLSLTAASCKETGEVGKARKSYLKTIEYAHEIYEETDPEVIFELLNYANFLLSVDDHARAGDILEKTEQLFARRGTDDGVYLALFYKARGLFYRNLPVESNHLTAFRNQKTANLKRAVSCYLKGIEALGVDRDRFNDASIFIENNLSLIQSLDILNLTADTYVQIADVYAESETAEEEESIQQALDYYILSANIIQQAGKEIFSDEYKMQLGAMKEATFFKIVRTAYRAYSLSPRHELVDLAFVYAERMKAGVVFDRLSDQFAKENSLVPDSLTSLERNLSYRITRQNEKLFNLKYAEIADSAEIAKTDSVIFHLKREQDALTRFIEAHYQDYSALKYGRITVSPASIRQKLKENEVLIEYVMQESGPAPALYAFFITPGFTDFHRLEIDSSFISHLEEAFHFMSNPRFLFTRNEESQHFCHAAHQLYKQLIDPFAEKIQHKKIIIVPDGKLNYLPFDALLTEMPDTAGTVFFNRLPWLIREHAVQYSYSANLMFGFSEDKREAEKKLLAFAPAYHSDTVLFEHEKLVLTPLPGVQREVDLISGKIPTRLYRGEEATEVHFREECSDYDILHLAMHAFINDSLPAFSRLAFAQSRETRPENDGWLNTADVYNFDLDARLTVLSACNTGTGNLKKGEGVMSLARGFFYAGCPSLIMTLWEVEDDAGTKIMHAFYRNLKKGRTPGEALRQAKLNYLENANSRMAHPHYWLNYLSIGKDIPLFTSYDLYFFLLLFITLAGVAIDQFIRLKKEKKRKKIE